MIGGCLPGTGPLGWEPKAGFGALIFQGGPLFFLPVGCHAGSMGAVQIVPLVFYPTSLWLFLFILS